MVPYPIQIGIIRPLPLIATHLYAQGNLLETNIFHDFIVNLKVFSIDYDFVSIFRVGLPMLLIVRLLALTMFGGSSKVEQSELVSY